MEKILTGKEYIIRDSSFDRLLVGELTGTGMEERRLFDRDAAMAALRADQALAARLLAASSQEMVYMGDLARRYGTLDGVRGTLGMRMDRASDSPRLTGDNYAGRFLQALAQDYRREMSEGAVVENNVERSRVMVDWTPEGEYVSDVTYHEESGARYIHVDRYIPKRFTFDANRSGTTGHAERRSADDIPFHTFECPFGTDSRSKITVDTAAEASLLYEKAIRGEMDWRKYFRDLREEGRLNRMSDSQMETYAADYRAQFDWVREQIATRSEELKALPVVTPSLLVPDTSMGRSVYDPVHAPSPAHVLEHYIHNPHLLSSVSESYVARALESQDKQENIRLTTGAKSLTVLIAGSDTIGGREPGTRATQNSVASYTVDKATGALRETGKTSRSVLQFKSEEQTRADYEALSSRLDSILSEVGEDITVRFVVAKGIGTPKMVERYVKEKGGVNLDWNFSRGRVAPRGRGEGSDSIQTVALDHFDECWPVLVGYVDRVNIQLDRMDEDSMVEFSRASGLGGEAAVVFSVAGDARNRSILEKGSLALGEGLPVIHVMENMREQDQLQALRSGSALSLSSSGDDDDLAVSIFSGEPRTSWNLQDGGSLVASQDENGVTIPLVLQTNSVPVTVGRMSYGTVFGAFCALLAGEAGEEAMGRAAAVADSTSSASERMVRMLNIYSELSGRTDRDQQERAMRRAVRLFAQTDLEFENYLVSIAGRDVMEQSSISAGKLFVDAAGHGENRFGVVLAHEAGRVSAAREAVRQKAEEAKRKAIEEAVKAQKLRTAQRAEGQKVVGGLPVIADAMDAVWFTGTAKPQGLLLDEEHRSFQAWDDENGADPLCREKAQRQFFTDTEGNRYPNDYVYLAASNLQYTTGVATAKNRANSRELTGCVRTDPATGSEYTCAFGIPVMHNWEGNELGNAQGMPCSFRLDNENAEFRNSVILADTQARSVALKYGLALCAEAKEGRNGDMVYSLSRVFRDRIYAAPKDDGTLTDPKTGERVYLKTTVNMGKVQQRSTDEAIARALQAKQALMDDGKQKRWIDNPHKAPLNEATVNRYMEMLQNGAELPLNCIPMRSTDYRYDATLEGSRDEARRRFLADFNMSLDMANSLAIALQKPLRFPLDAAGRLDLGPNVPEDFRQMAEQKVDAFLGVSSRKAVEGPLPFVERITMYEAAASCKAATGRSVFMRPSDLVYAFGRYDFSGVEIGGVPMHEMAFRFDDGSALKLTDPRLSSRLDRDDVNGYLSYTKNDERKFTVKSSDPEKTEWQLAVIQSYIERAKAVRVEAALFEEGTKETRDLGLEGYVDLKSSNSLEHAANDWEIEGREQKPWETVGRFNGIDEEHVYDGRVDAGDAFRGYAMMRYVLPDGTQSSWKVITDRELAKEIVFSNVNRVYRSDEFVPASKHVIDMMLTAEAVKDAGWILRKMDFHSRKQTAVDDKIVEINRTELLKTEPRVEPKTVNVFAGKSENAALSNFAVRRFKIDINKYTKGHGIK